MSKPTEGTSAGTYAWKRLKNYDKVYDLNTLQGCKSAILDLMDCIEDLHETNKKLLKALG